MTGPYRLVVPLSTGVFSPIDRAETIYLVFDVEEQDARKLLTFSRTAHPDADLWDEGDATYSADIDRRRLLRCGLRQPFCRAAREFGRLPPSFLRAPHSGSLCIQDPSATVGISHT